MPIIGTTLNREEAIRVWALELINAADKDMPRAIAAAEMVKDWIINGIPDPAKVEAPR